MTLKYVVPIILMFGHFTARIAATEIDFCSADYMCGTKHVLACNHTGAFSSLCPANAEMIPMTKELKDFFVGEHNMYRNEIAKGLIYKPAAAMATLEWDDILAKLAEYNVKQCGIIYEDQKCITSRDYFYIDQNIGRVFLLRREYNRSRILDEIRKDIKQYWFDQHKHCTQKEIDSYKPPEIELILHFGKMMLDRNNRIGCAVSLYESTYGYNILYTCNYARRLFCYKPIIRSGRYPGSHCATGMNSEYPFLCSTKEKFDVNDYKI